MTTEPQPNPNPSLNSKLDPHSGPASQGVVFGEHLLESRLVEALDLGDFDTALEVWQQSDSSPERLERFNVLVHSWVEEPEDLGPPAAQLVAEFSSKGLSVQDQAAHSALANCGDHLPASGDAEGLRFWMLARGIEASPEYIRHLWRKVSNQVEVDTFMLAARQAPELPTLPPDAPQADGPVR